MIVEIEQRAARVTTLSQHHELHSEILDVEMIYKPIP